MRPQPRVARARGLAGILLALALAAPFAPAQEEPAQEEPAQEEPAQVEQAREDKASLRIGLVLPASGGENRGAAELRSAVAESALMGATMAEEEFGFNAELLGFRLELLTAEAGDAAAARKAAGRLLADEGVFALIGGLADDQALALAEVAEERQVPFLNIGSSDDRLRNQACVRHAFHVAPSAAMYLDALAGWFIRAGFRNWAFVVAETPEGAAHYERIRWSMRQRHFGAREVARVRVAPGAGFEDALNALRRARPQVVLLLLEPERQLEFLERAEAAGLEAEVTGFPHTAAQTRAFFAASAAAAPALGAGYRAVAWEATLDAYGARELNARFAQRWGVPMDYPAWAAYQAIKIVFETVSLGGASDGAAAVRFLESPQSVFDVWKGIGVTFRPWDHQLRQSLYLVDVMAEAEEPRELATLVGELPAIYLPRTEPVERLDQLGDLARESECEF
jgi:ABC transporter substrate binding protein (PQQ-dependent alcohol dehydrogenase system)